MDQNDYKEIFEPFEKLIEIEILGKKFEVPENNTLLRCFQFLSLETISQGDFCWNRDCMNCQVWIDNDGAEKGLIACRAIVADGMKIVRLHEEIEFDPPDASASEIGDKAKQQGSRS